MNNIIFLFHNIIDTFIKHLCPGTECFHKLQLSVNSFVWFKNLMSTYVGSENSYSNVNLPINTRNTVCWCHSSVVSDKTVMCTSSQADWYLDDKTLRTSTYTLLVCNCISLAARDMLVVPPYVNLSKRDTMYTIFSTFFYQCLLPSVEQGFLTTWSWPMTYSRVTKHLWVAVKHFLWLLCTQRRCSDAGETINLCRNHTLKRLEATAVCETSLGSDISL